MHFTITEQAILRRRTYVGNRSIPFAVGMRIAAHPYPRTILVKTGHTRVCLWQRCYCLAKGSHAWNTLAFLVVVLLAAVRNVRRRAHVIPAHVGAEWRGRIHDRRQRTGVMLVLASAVRLEDAKRPAKLRERRTDNGGGHCKSKETSDENESGMAV
jgi:hypothetical protein